MSESETNNITSNVGYQDFSALQLRLDTQKLHKDIWNFLKGSIIIQTYNPNTQESNEVELQSGHALANEEGIQNILSFIVGTCNSHTVQGNTDKAELYEILYTMNIQLAQMLTMNSTKWGIDKKNRRHIINTLIHMLHLFLSRTINNEERKSYVSLVKQESRLSEELKKKGFV